MPAPPPCADWLIGGIALDPLGNLDAGCCVEAAALHHAQVAAANTKRVPFLPTADQCLAWYSVLTGYNRQTGANDHGTSILDMLKDWKASKPFGDELWAYMAFSPWSPNQLALAVHLFASGIIAVALPAAWKGRSRWDTGRGPLYRPGTWGLHCVPINAYDSSMLRVVSWGKIVEMSWAAYLTYTLESWAVLDASWADNNAAPNGLKLDLLRHDLALLPNQENHYDPRHPKVAA